MRYYLIFLLFLTGCNKKKEITSFSGTDMTIGWEVKVAKKLTAKERAKVHEVIASSFSTIDMIFNNWNPYSEISKLNQMGAHQKVLISEELSFFLHKIDGFVTFTEGRFDPTIEPLQKLYKASFAKGLLPAKKKVEALEESVGWQNIHLEGRTFWKEHPKTAIDLSGVAKGYCVDLITESLSAIGYNDIYVEWGGEIRTMGAHLDRSPWRISIVGSSIVTMEDEAIATSGDFFQRWNVEGVTYTHIFDPKTKRPLQVTESSIPSAAVKSASCAEADAMATCLMLFPTTSEAKAWAEEKKLSVWIIVR